ncbi:FAD-binding oxidoreductase [Marinobacter salinus]|uniref:D-2-hydroxyglutarate dehydrogenase n=1 Tax=Marinobacter salinus TaxID=1874317 RepID=A0A1D9GLG9_9GAMM|nr:FAD-binding and (Fe-S)-binding domain-containing protein [Marinobacter salinus]AOY88487.1 FAD-binding oxidoreductase [Marinobacter salinus]
MLPRLEHTTPTQSRYLAFLKALKHSGFNGEMTMDYATRTVLATDNSIYQVLPQAVIFPTNKTDVQRLGRLASRTEWRDIVFSPRGGGTGTNGQSLTDGIVVDLSRHMNRILEINAAEGWARVEAGVVKDQLNAAVKSHGLFFAPELSTSNRATIGGMINTDASGQGSVMYGKTRNHVLELETVLVDGSLLQSRALETEQEEKAAEESTLAGAVYRTLAGIWDRRKDDIEKHFPKLNRCLTGYDLAHLRDDAGRMNANNVLCGSEGTLGFVVEAKVNLVPIPKYQALVVVQYDSFDASLRDARALMSARPASIETIDSKVLELAQTDIVWQEVADYFQIGEGSPVEGVNLVEYTGDDKSQVLQDIKALTDILGNPERRPACLYSVALGENAVNQIWTMRKRSVGLLAKTSGEARPVAFVEDTAVPPEHLADFIRDFREVLDQEGLSYGMFGHVDAGVLHVRPALDLKEPETITTVRRVTEKVVALVQKYHGLLWGEHGKGFRSEFAPSFFGDLYPELQLIKRTFDPFNQLNPGKIATPDANIPLVPMDEPGQRGTMDRTIPAASRRSQPDAMNCNGNGACYNYDPDDAMCPSWKATRDRRHSPKGRASLIREWLRLLGEQNVDIETLARRMDAGPVLRMLPDRMRYTLARNRGQYDFSHEVREAMDGCLSCKSCSGQCPVQVDIPEVRARFLHLYHGRYLRPVKDHLIGRLEQLIPLIANPLGRPIYNSLMTWFPTRALIRRLGMVDSPLLSKRSPLGTARRLGIRIAREEELKGLDERERERSLIIVQDAFTSYFETDTFTAILECLQRLGFRVWLLPFHPNGKPLHVHGFLKQFRKTATSHTRLLASHARSGIPMVGIDPSMTLAFRAEYRKYVSADVPNILLLQEYLSHRTELFNPGTRLQPDQRITLLGHCSEKTNVSGSMAQWQHIFSAVGVPLDIESVGCCGMAGTYGHESRHAATSKRIYELSWNKKVQMLKDTDVLLATGYSCRSQVKRFENLRIQHPLEYLGKHLQSGIKGGPQ